MSQDKIGPITRALVGVPIDRQGVVLDVLNRLNPRTDRSYDWHQRLAKLLKEPLPPRRRHLGEILLSQGKINQEQLEAGLSSQKKFALSSGAPRFGETLVALEYCTEMDVTRALCEQGGHVCIDLDEAERFPVECLKITLDEKAKMTADFIREFTVLPFHLSNTVLTLVIHDPLDIETMDTIQFRLNRKLSFILAPKSQILKFIEQLFPV